eukprot:6710035-Lingulodinium_polyedra.AAC.1
MARRGLAWRGLAWFGVAWRGASSSSSSSPPPPPGQLQDNGVGCANVDARPFMHNHRNRQNDNSLLHVQLGCSIIVP